MVSTVFVNGRTWSPADQGEPVVTELLVIDGRIAAVGTNLVRPDGCGVVDLAGGTLLPAFADGHAHPLQGGLEGRFAPVRGTSIPAILDGVRTWAAANPATEWIYGGGFDLSLVADGVFEAAWLDDVVPDRPVVLRGTDYHTLWCNSLALQRAGISADTPQPPDGEIVKDGAGQPIGTLREWGATDPVFAVMPKPALAQQIDALDEATRRCAAAGLTWVQDAWVEPFEVPAYLAAAAAGVLHTAVNLALRADPLHWAAQVRAFGVLRDRVRTAGHPRLTADTVKFFVDGVIESGTAAMLEPYDDCPHSHGLPNWDAGELTAAVAAFSAAGFQVHLHAIGDAAIRDALDAIEASSAVNRELRPVIAHLQVIDPADLDRLAALGVIACFQPLWAQPDPLQEVLTIPRIGPERASRQYPMQTLLRSGAAVSFGSDWPVTDVEPLPGIVTAVTRQTPDGEPEGGWCPDERLTIAQAFTAYTAGSARQGFRDEAGRLTVGAPADLTWIDGLDVSVLQGAVVRGTWLAGERTY